MDEIRAGQRARGYQGRTIETMQEEGKARQEEVEDYDRRCEQLWGGAQEERDGEILDGDEIALGGRDNAQDGTSRMIWAHVGQLVAARTELVTFKRGMRRKLLANTEL
jgi:hypothetical protein